MRTRELVAAAPLAFLCAGCAWAAAFVQTVRDSALPGLFALLGYVLGPGGLVTPLLVFGGGVVGELIGRSTSLASGDLQGRGAHEKELEDLRRLVPELKKAAEDSAEKVTTAQRAVGDLQRALRFVEHVAVAAALLALAWFLLVRNRAHLADLRPGTFWATTKHIVVGGDRPRARGPPGAPPAGSAGP